MKEQELIKIYRLSVGPLYGFVRRKVGGNRQLAEDIVQETYLRAVKQWSWQGIPQKPGAWLARVASNLVASHYRKKPMEPLAEPDRVVAADRRTRSARSPTAIHRG